jgi:glycosyltransferase involved in cell wall biosynthesis
MNITLVLLTMNELDGSKALFEQIPWRRFEDALVLDGKSTDGTREFFESKGIRVVSQKNEGLGNAVIEAMTASTGEAVVFFHPDGNMNPNDTLKFRPLFEQGYEFVVASRMMKGGYNEEDVKWIKFRKWANITFAWIAAALWSKPGCCKATDPVNGFRGITRDAFERMVIDATDCSVDYQMLIRAYKKKIKLIEFPTIEGSRIAGTTRFRSLPTGIREVKMLLREMLYPPSLDY